MSFAGLIGLLTRFPVSGESLEESARSTHLLPVVGLLVGSALYAVSLPLALFVPQDLAAVLLLIAIYLLTGILHLDGLADFGDAMAMPGTREERTRAMKDVRVGIGGILAVLSVLLVQLAALRFMMAGASPQPLLGLLPFGQLAVVLITSEVAAKLSMGTSMALGKPTEGGMGAPFVSATGPRHLAAILVLSVLIGLALSGMRGLVVLTGMAVGGIVALMAHRLIGGVNGDILGASNEVGRAVALATWVVISWTL